MRLLLLSMFLIFYQVSFGQQKKVCFTFDDLPVVNYGITDSVYQKALFNKIVFSLKTNNVPAIGFVNGRKLYDNKNEIQYQVGLLENWVSSGLELGNHTFSHPDYNKVSFSNYTDDLIKENP